MGKAASLEREFEKSEDLRILSGPQAREVDRSCQQKGQAR